MGTLAEPVTAPLTAGPCGPGEPNELLTAALAYAARGWPVFPLADRDKVPRPGSRGFKDATCDREQIARWWAEHPHANIGIATGGGLLVVDVDGDEGRASIQGKHLPPTVCAMTARGCHYFFAGDGRCMTGLLPGIDIRGAGGYVVAAPSVHPTGAAYCWAPGLSPDDLPLAPAPDWLTEAATPTPARRTGARLPEAVPCPMAERCEVSTAYGLAALRNVTRELAAAPVGTRNARLTAAALRSGNLVGGGEVSWADAVHELREACEANGLLADEDRKTTSTLYANLGKGSLSPCRPRNVPIHRDLLSAGLSEGGLRYACLLALFGNVTQKAMAEQVGITDRCLRNWREAFDQADQAAGGTLTQIATERPTRNFVPAPATLLLDASLPLTLALHLRALEDDKRGGLAIVGQEKLCELTGLPRRTLCRHAAALQAAGWLYASQSAYCGAKGRRLGVNVYALRDRPNTGAVGLPATNRNEMAHRPTRATETALPNVENSPKPERNGTSTYTSRWGVNREGRRPLPGRSKETTTTDAESVAVGRSTHQDQPPGRPSAVSLAVGRRPVRHTNDTVHTANAPDPTSPVQHSEWHEPTDEEHAANLAAIPGDILAYSVAACRRGDELLGRDPRDIHRPEDLGRGYVAMVRRDVETYGADVWRELFGLPQPQEVVEVACTPEKGDAFLAFPQSLKARR